MAVPSSLLEFLMDFTVGIFASSLQLSGWHSPLALRAST
jgi:hypothetical protein